MILDTTSKVLRIVLGEAHTTNPCQCVSSWAEGAAPDIFSPGNTNILTNGTTPVVVVAAPTKSGRSRDAREVRVFNNDTVSHTVTLQLFDGSTAWTIAPAKVTVPANGAFIYTPGAGITVVQSPVTGLTVTDGTNTVAGTTNLTFAGAVVSGTSPNATATIALLQNYLTGLNVTIASTTSFSVAAGMAMSDDNTTLMTLGSSLSKLSGGTWVAGNNQNGLDTGTIAINTWYHIYLIYNPTSNTTDLLFSTNASSPSMPVGYTKKRRIASCLLTDAASHFLTVIQNYDRFDWAVPVNDIASNTPGVTTGALVTLASVPLGIKVQAILTGNITDASAGSGLYLSSPAQTDVAFGVAAITAQVVTGGVVSYLALIETDTSQRIRRRVSATTTTFLTITNGWFDTRGR